VHVVNDLLDDLAGAVVEARLAWPGGSRKWFFGGQVPASSCSFVGTVNAVLPRLAALEADTGGPSSQGTLWPLELRLELRWGSPGQSVSNYYESQLVDPHRTRH